MVRTHALDGAGIGFVVGALVTVIAVVSEEEEPGCTGWCVGPIIEPEVEFVGSFLLGGLGGGLLGAVIGSLIETETWVPVMGFEVAGGGSAGPDRVRLSWSVPVGGR